MPKIRDLVDRLDNQDARFNSIDERLHIITLRLDQHDINHHGKKTTAIHTVMSGGGGVLILGIIAAVLKALGVEY